MNSDPMTFITILEERLDVGHSKRHGRERSDIVVRQSGGYLLVERSVFREDDQDESEPLQLVRVENGTKANLIRHALRLADEWHAEAKERFAREGRTVPGSTIFPCRCCEASAPGYNDGTILLAGWSRILRIDGPDAICPRCINDPESLDSLREEYPDVAIAEARS